MLGTCNVLSWRHLKGPPSLLFPSTSLAHHPIYSVLYPCDQCCSPCARLCTPFCSVLHPSTLGHAPAHFVLCSIFGAASHILSAAPHAPVAAPCMPCTAPQTCLYPCRGVDTPGSLLSFGSTGLWNLGAQNIDPPSFIQGILLQFPPQFTHLLEMGTPNGDRNVEWVTPCYCFGELSSKGSPGCRYMSFLTPRPSLGCAVALHTQCCTWPGTQGPWGHRTDSGRVTQGQRCSRAGAPWPLLLHTICHLQPLVTSVPVTQWHAMAQLCPAPSR